MINDSINRFLGILCYPLVSLELFAEDSINDYINALKRGDKKAGIQIRKRIQGNVVDYIRRNYSIYSYDEIYLYLEKCYLYDAGKYENSLQLYQQTMKKMASTLMSHRDGRIVFKYWKNKDDENIFGGFAGNSKITLFHSLNCHIPLDVVAIIYMVLNQERLDTGCLDYFYGNIEVADQQLSRVLEKGVAENHLHKGVSRTFSSIWDSLMEPLTRKKMESFNHPLLPNGRKGQNEKLLFHILGSGIARMWMTFQLADEENCCNQIEGLELMITSFCSGHLFQEYYEEHFRSKTKKEVIAYYIEWWEKIADFLPEHALEERICSLILDEDRTLHTFDENVFLYRALYHMFRGEADERFNQCLMQYLRIRNYLFHISVQQKTIKGLDYFQQEHYRINSTLNRVNVNNFWENAIREQLQNQNLQKVEFRTSMTGNYSDFKKDVKRFLEAYKRILEDDYCERDGEKYIPQRKFPQVGLVIHFLKRTDETTPEKCVQNGAEECSYLHYGEIFKGYSQGIESFKKLRSEYSELSRYLVGIDAASLENSTPVWVFSSIYEQARDSKIDQIGRNAKDFGYTQSLGFTFHAGEDFRHILSGLRRIDEAVECLKFHAGDRIGHGIALGISARTWKNQNPVVIIPQIEALENYLWAYDTLSKNYSDFQATVLSYMEKMIFELAAKIYGNVESIKTDTLIVAYQKLFSHEHLEYWAEEKTSVIEQNLCDKVCAGKKVDWDVELLVASRHCKKFVTEMERPIHYEITEQDLLIIEGLQKIMMEKLGNKGIVVEVNPTSNTAIADMDVFGQNQFYQLNQVFDKNNVITCINSDDPAVFNTNVSNELSYIYYGMLEQGVSREAGLLWIDRIRENGLQSSFIRHNEPDEVLLERLNALIKKM